MLHNVMCYTVAMAPPATASDSTYSGKKFTLYNLLLCCFLLSECLLQVVMGYTVAMAGALLALQAVPAEAKALQWIAIAALGFSIYGPQMLIGLSGAELVSPGAVGASQGILGWIAYLGAANAGIPIAHVVQSHGWAGFFTAMLGACGVALLLLATVANAQSYGQRQAKAAAA
jgi:sugar phosphate permease